MSSPSLLVGQSYLPNTSRIRDVKAFLRIARRRIVRHPEVAAEIVMVASLRIIEQVPASELQSVFSEFVRGACAARDRSMRP